MYEIREDFLGTKIIVRTNDDGTESGIPFDETNTDYQAYLTWKAEQ